MPDMLKRVHMFMITSLFRGRGVNSPLRVFVCNSKAKIEVPNPLCAIPKLTSIPPTVQFILRLFETPLNRPPAQISQAFLLPNRWKSQTKAKKCIHNHQNCTRWGGRPVRIAQKSCCARPEPPPHSAIVIRR